MNARVIQTIDATTNALGRAALEPRFSAPTLVAESSSTGRIVPGRTGFDIDVGVLLCALAVILGIVGGIFAALPWLIVTGPKRWLTFGAFAAIGFGVGAGVLAALGSATSAHLWLAAGIAIVATGVLSVDLAGTTPWYGSYINRFHNPALVDLVETRCTGAAECVQVCPRNVLEMNGHRRKVEIKRPEQCIQCGACIVQCPEDALRFRYDDGRIVEAATIRRTRMNMVGQRIVELPEP